MAILDIDLTIQTSDAFSDSNNTIITVGFDPRTSQDSVLKRVNLAANTEKLIFSNSEYGKSYLYLKNMGSENIDIQATGGSTIYASLAELEFAFKLIVSMFVSLKSQSIVCKLPSGEVTLITTLEMNSSSFIPSGSSLLQE